MTEQTIDRASLADVGCWLEGSRGWRISGHVVELAQDCGFTIDDADQAALTRWLDGESEDDDTEIVMYLCDDAEAWLNANVAPAGAYFAFEDGEFYLLAETGDEDDD